MAKVKKWYHSSMEEGKIAMRIRGVLYAALPIAVLIAQGKGWDIGEEGFKYIIDVIVTAASGLFTFIGVCVSIWGHIRRKI